MKIIVIGHKQHGKGTFAKIATEMFGIPSMGTSQFNANLLFEIMHEEFGYSNADECYNDRGNHRETWFKEIYNHCKSNPAQVIEDIFIAHDICEGPRNRIEFDCAKERGAFDLVVWVDSSKRKAVECKSSMELSQDDADIIITNNGAEIEFINKVINLLKALFPNKAKQV